MIKLYTTPACKLCRQAKAALDAAGIKFEARDLNDDQCFFEFLDLCQAIDITPPKVMPVLIMDEDVWTGEDVLIGIQEGEIKNGES